MATLDALKGALRRRATTTMSNLQQPLTDAQYSAGFDLLLSGSGWTTYQDFIIPQLSQLLEPLFNSRTSVSVLEIGPGPMTVLEYLPDRLKRKIGGYTAYEPNEMFAARLEEHFHSSTPPLPCLQSPLDIRIVPFNADSKTKDAVGSGTSYVAEKFDVVLFCHSMYGMSPKRSFIEFALDLLVESPAGGMVVVFHRDGVLDFGGLVCHRTASFSAGTVHVADDDKVLDILAPFVAGFAMMDTKMGKAIKREWREECRLLSRHRNSHPAQLLFSSPNVMVAFTRHATTLPELVSLVPSVEVDRIVKNREACFHRPAARIKPTKVQHVQRCVEWGLDQSVGLTVLGGGHSGHCLQSHVVAIDMRAFNQVHVTFEQDKDNSTCVAGLESSFLVVAGAGCTTGDIVREALAVGVTVPLGARPSVGAGLWLQGGVGHLGRLYGLTCDAIVGAVLVSVHSAQVLCVGHVPSKHRPTGAVRPKNEDDLMWAIKGAGTNFGIVLSVVFKAFAAPMHAVRSWVVPLRDDDEARRRLSEFDQLVAKKLPRHCSADAYLYWKTGQLHLGVTTFESLDSGLTRATSTPASRMVSAIMGKEDSLEVVDSVGLFETEMYMSGMHGGHGSGKTSSFKRCLFVKGVGGASVSDVLLAYLRNRPTDCSYVHLLHGGGAIADVAADATAFGSRDWDFACVITAVWPREQDGTQVASIATDWVYAVTHDLLSLSTGVYSADLGPDSRDATLVAQAFGSNSLRLARLKRHCDPRNVLAYTCPLPELPMEPRLIILVTGDCGVGKDYCANTLVSLLTYKGLTARAVSISDVTKREYSMANGANLSRLHEDRVYKERHRPALTAFYQGQVRQRPRLPEEHFLDVVHDAANTDVLFITGMRDKAPVAFFSPLVSCSRLLEVCVEASNDTRRARRESCGGEVHEGSDSTSVKEGQPILPAFDYRPSLTLDNEKTGNEDTIAKFADDHLLPFFHPDVQRLADMVRFVPNFPRPGINFRHILGICQAQGGLDLCTKLLQKHFIGDWAQVDVVACCEVGGLVFASPLAKDVALPLALVRKAGKLPPPTLSVDKPTSHISYSPSSSMGESIELDHSALHRGASVVVVDDVLATGETLCAVLQLLSKAGVSAEKINVLCVAEFPFHGGRDLLRRRGFGCVNIQSLLLFGGA